jgi:hypothetical protein
MCKVLIVASGQTAINAPLYEDKVDYVVVINNAWKAVNKWDYWIRPHDYRGEKIKRILKNNQKVITPDEYECSLKKFGDYRACGLSITLNSSYWVLDNLKPTSIYYLGADMNYTPDEFGNTHFYGKGHDILTQGISDPDRMVQRRSKGNPNYLNELYLRFKMIAKEHNCNVYNLSNIENTRLPFPKVNDIYINEKSLPNILFVHISKTAGKALVKSIKSNYNDKSILEVYRKTPMQNGLTINPNEYIETCLKQQYTSNELDNIEFFAGHVAYGIHSMFKQKFDYITMVREPVDRIVSHYYYSLKTDLTVKEKYADLEDYVENRIDIHNWMTKRLSNVDFNGGDLDLAKKNIVENFALCGITEKYEETLALLTKMYGLSLKNITVNKNSDRVPISDIDEKIINKIKTIHYKDIQLYKFAKEIFEIKLKENNI